MTTQLAPDPEAEPPCEDQNPFPLATMLSFERPIAIPSPGSGAGAFQKYKTSTSNLYFTLFQIDLSQPFLTELDRVAVMVAEALRKVQAPEASWQFARARVGNLAKGGKPWSAMRMLVKLLYDWNKALSSREQSRTAAERAKVSQYTSSQQPLASAPGDTERLMSADRELHGILTEKELTRMLEEVSNLGIEISEQQRLEMRSTAARRVLEQYTLPSQTPQVGTSPCASSAGAVSNTSMYAPTYCPRAPIAVVSCLTTDGNRLAPVPQLMQRENQVQGPRMDVPYLGHQRTNESSAPYEPATKYQKL